MTRTPGARVRQCAHDSYDLCGDLHRRYRLRRAAKARATFGGRQIGHLRFRARLPYRAARRNRFADLQALNRHPRFLRLAIHAAGKSGQFRPHRRPVVAQILTGYLAVRIAFDQYTQLAAELLFRAPRFAHVPFRRAAAGRKVSAGFLVQAVEVGDELVHSHHITRW